jgi:hypothetical protein
MHNYKKLYKVYAGGGNMSLFGSLAGVGAGILDGFTPANEAPGLGLSGAKGALSGAASGAAFGPLGAGIGGALGLTMGLINGAQQKRDFERAKQNQYQANRTNDMNRSQAALAADPSLATGVRGAQYYEMGGVMSNPMVMTPQRGGKLRPVSSNNTVVEGRTHEQGGVKLPEYNAELEDQETTAGNRVFSAELGFAQMHKPIAKAIGKIEMKPVTKERVNAMDRLKQKENELYQAQELYKSYLNLV